MNLNVTLSPTPTITSGFVMAVIFTRADSPSDIRDPFDINNIPASSIVYSSATAAPILSNTPLTTPSLPAANYYGLMIGKSALGTLADIVPMTAEILSSTLSSDASTCGSNATYSLSFP